ncbi:hypothetical protein [Bosea sp. MMO-172]|uniref:hypothetical protein n=1 Tax=Bosea sp. MMO-172 TaxID=3127885 RepID=UPI003019C77C
MSEESLLSAARRARRFFLIDETHGGLTSLYPLIAMDTLALQIEKETQREKERAAGIDQPADEASSRS